jgi:hypothetical protein
MAIQATSRGGSLATITATNVALVRGVRVILDSSGTVSVAAATVRGEYVTSQAIAADATGAGFPTSEAASVPALASEAVAVGDAAYAAASGKFSKTSTNAAYMGVWTLAASGDGVLGAVELKSVA